MCYNAYSPLKWSSKYFPTTHNLLILGNNAANSPRPNGRSFRSPLFPAEPLRLERCSQNLIITPVTTWQTTPIRHAYVCYECVFIHTFTLSQQWGIQQGEMNVWSREKNKVRDRILPPWSWLWAWWRWGKTIWTTPPLSRHVVVFVTKLKAAL